MLQPGFNRQLNTLGSSIIECYKNTYGHYHFVEVGNGDLGFVTGYGYLLYSLVEGPVVLKPATPERADAFTAFIVHGAEKIIRGRMFKSPVLYIFFKSIIKTVVPQYTFTQQV